MKLATELPKLEPISITQGGNWQCPVCGEVYGLWEDCLDCIWLDTEKVDDDG